MKSFRHRLPPANSLLVFESVARCQGFTAAARELGVSQAATSRQIANLEAHLGAPLFRREKKRIRLTAEGEALYQAVAMGLGHIAGTWERLRRPGGPAQLTVATTVAFSAFWLMPRLVGFHAADSGSDLHLVTSDTEPERLGQHVDLAVAYGLGDWPGYRAERLFGDRILAVAAPARFAGRALPEAPADLLRETLLHTDSDQPSWLTWRGWLARNGVAVPASLPGPHFNNYGIVIQACLEGRGVALGWERLLAPRLADGSLRAVTAGVVVPEEGYYLLWPEQARGGPEMTAFRDWLLAEAAREEPAAAGAERGPVFIGQ